MSRKTIEFRFKRETIDAQQVYFAVPEQNPKKFRTTHKSIGWWKGSSSNERPPFSYSELIAFSILSSKDCRLTLAEIYEAISKRYPCYTLDNKAWKNSIRHNLSLKKKWFIKHECQSTLISSGRKLYWTLQPDFRNSVLKDYGFKAKL